MALQANPDITVEREGLLASEAEILRARSAFAPAFLSSLSSRERRSVSPLTTGNSGVTFFTKNSDLELEARKRLATGATVGLTGTLSKVNDFSTSGSILDPYYTSRVGLSLSQPLLKGAGVFVSKSGIVLAQKSADASKARFRQVVMDTLRGAENGYWDLHLARQNTASQRESLKAAERLMQMTRRLQELQVLARADVVETEREAASREEGVLRALELSATADAGLKTLLNDPEPESGPTLELAPVEQPRFQDVRFVPDEEIQRALRLRPEIRSARLALEAQEVRVRVARNGLWPGLSAQAQLGYSGLSGKSRFDPTAGVSFVSPYEGGPGASLGHVRRGLYPDWRLSLSLEVPFGFGEARAELAQREGALRQAEIELEKQRRAVIRQVRAALRLVGISQKRMRSAVRSRELAEQQLQDGERQLQLGATNTTRVILFIDALANARLRENEALVSYVKALVDLERADGMFLEARGIELKED